MPERAFFMPMEQIKKLIKNEKNQRRLLLKMEDAFSVYEKFENKDYLFVTEDGSCHPAVFLQNDFVHLTGIKILIDNVEFYNDLKKEEADTLTLIQFKSTRIILSIRK